MSDLSFEFLNWQREVYTANSRFSVVVAGRRTGKTRFAAVMLVIKALQCTHKDATVLYAAPTYSMARVLMWDLVCELARPVTAKVNISDGEVTLINGVKIRIRGADHPDSLRGTSCSTLYWMRVKTCVRLYGPSSFDQHYLT